MYAQGSRAFQVNPKYVAALEQKGMMFVGHDINNERMEVMELPGAPVSLHHVTAHVSLQTIRTMLPCSTTQSS